MIFCLLISNGTLSDRSAKCAHRVRLPSGSIAIGEKSKTQKKLFGRGSWLKAPVRSFFLFLFTRTRGRQRRRVAFRAFSFSSLAHLGHCRRCPGLHYYAGEANFSIQPLTIYKRETPRAAKGLEKKLDSPRWVAWYAVGCVK